MTRGGVTCLSDVSSEVRSCFDAASISIKQKFLSTQPSPIRAPQPGERKCSSFSSLLKTLSSPLRGSLASLAPYIEETQKHARFLARTTSGQHILGCATCHRFFDIPLLNAILRFVPPVQPEVVVSRSLKPPITVRSPPMCSRNANPLACTANDSAVRSHFIRSPVPNYIVRQLLTPLVQALCDNLAVRQRVKIVRTIRAKTPVFTQKFTYEAHAKIILSGGEHAADKSSSVSQSGRRPRRRSQCWQPARR